MPSILTPRAPSFCRAAIRAQPAQRKAPMPTAYRTLTTATPSSTPKHPSRRCAWSHTSLFLPTRPTASASLRRPYHSYDHPSPHTPFSLTERAILTAAYAHVPNHGFSHEALALGARDAGYLDVSTNLLPHGVFSLVQWHMVAQREALAGRASALFSGEQRIGVGTRVEVLVWERLMGNTAVIGRWQEVRNNWPRVRNAWKKVNCR